MSAAVCVLILSALWGHTVVSGDLSRPTKVRLTSHDMNLVLSWDLPAEPAGLLYTTEYRSSVINYRAGCVNISTLECDFTRHSIPQTIYQFGKYTARVRAHSGTETSAWVESNNVAMDKETNISSPIISLLSNGAAIEVIIQDPVFRISSLRQVYSSATYNITYWQDSQKQKTRSISNIQQSRVVLSDLEPWTKYCVKVQISTGRISNNLSQPSADVCESTTIDKEVPWVAAVVTFITMAIAVALVVVAVVYRKRISHLLCPKDSLPQHFKEDLMVRPNSSMYIAMCNSHPSEEIFHQVSIIPDSSIIEAERPLEAEPPHTTQT
ncbi:hypothetical protein PBY51_022892 [Eleginops maclovinus]|uniref:Interleukin-10 receptor subunit beta-like n=1 Tax=Eleginops maclovinus TaxID=56733 RepID=A0AAN7XG68_ELEMC|nr:hypothetical protein PBY51_022892 [Eleginops maclovinus]